MVQSCCVRGCHNRSNRETDRRYFCIPTVVTGKGKETEELTLRRRREWLAKLQLKGLTFQSTATRTVCSDHFVHGTKAYLWDINKPNWIPTLHLGYDTKEKDSTRYDRLYVRKDRVSSSSKSKLSSQLSENILSTEDVHGDGVDSAAGLAAAAPPDTDGLYGTFCQTDLAFNEMREMTAQEERMLREELNRLTVENLELKEKLASKDMTLESLREQEDTVRYFTGLPTFHILATVFDFISCHMPSDKRRILSPFQALMLTFMAIRLNTPLQHLAYIFCVSRTTASKVFHETIHVLYSRLKPVVFWPDKESIRTSLPAQFLDRPGRRVVSIIDCFEIFIERPSSSDSSALTWSNYKHNNTIKYLISITPQGHVSFISKGWGGRVSDKQITKESGYLDNLLPTDLVLADRGFDIAELVGLRAAEVMIPAFTRGKDQLTAGEIESTRKLAHLRIHIERVIGLLCGKYSIMNGTIPIELLFVRAGDDVTTLDKIVTVGCGLVNLCPPII